MTYFLTRLLRDELLLTQVNDFEVSQDDAWYLSSVVHNIVKSKTSASETSIDTFTQANAHAVWFLIN